jgi:predicted acylesterase/phospholipase RssA
MDAYTAVVFSGGGAMAVSFIGAVRYLEHTAMLANIKAFAGTSAGCIISFLLILGMNTEMIMEWVIEHLAVLTDVDVDHILELPMRLGLDDGTALVESLRNALPQEWGRAVTFMELTKRSGKHFVVCATNVSKGAREFFSVDTMPHMDVVTAIRMSCSIPLVYTPVTHNGDLYVDGALHNNLPIDFSTSTSMMNHHILALNIDIHYDQIIDINISISANPNIFEYVFMLVRAAVMGANCKSSSTDCDVPNTRVVNLRASNKARFSVRSLKYDISTEDVKDMVQMGYNDMKKEFATTCSKQDNIATTTCA